MSGSTQGDRKLAKPAPNETATPIVPANGGTSTVGAPVPRRRSGNRILRWYFALKYRVFRRERRPDDGRRGLVMLQIDALAYAELRRAIELGYCPTIETMVRDEGFT